MEAQGLQTVPFGKHKGNPITTLINDTKYYEWCKKQPNLLEKYPHVFNIYLYETTSNQNSKTPEHNKLQNLFLDDENIKKLLKKLYNKNSKNVKIETGKVKFEGMYNWDLLLCDFTWYRDCDCSHECDCNILKKHCKEHKIPSDGEDLKYDELYCEIKPLMGDDYPCVLRKMTKQIELTNNYAKKQNEETEQRYIKEYKEGYFWRSNKDLYHYDLKQAYINPKYALILGDFNSSTTTKEQLIKIFKNSDIKIVFIDELIKNEQPAISAPIEDESKSLTYTNNDALLELKKKLLVSEEKNKLLEEKIKQLEEIQLLKT